MIDGFDARSWHRLVTLVAPGLVSRPASQRSRNDSRLGGITLVLFEDTSVLHAVHTTRGAIETRAWEGPETLGALMEATGSHFAVAARVGAIDTLLDRLGGRLAFDDDFAEVVTTVVGAVRELVDEGALVLRPSLPEGVPIPSAEVLRKTFDLFVAPGQAVVIALFDQGSLDTCALLSRDTSGRVSLGGPQTLTALTGPLTGQPHIDHLRIRQAIERAHGPLTFGLFARTSVVENLLRDGTPGVWAQAIAARMITVDPLPAWLALAAGAGAVRRAVTFARDTVGNPTWLDPFARRLRETVDRAVAVDPTMQSGPVLLRSLAVLLRASVTRPEDTRDRR